MFSKSEENTKVFNKIKSNTSKMIYGLLKQIRKNVLAIVLQPQIILLCTP